MSRKTTFKKSNMMKKGIEVKLTIKVKNCTLDLNSDIRREKVNANKILTKIPQTQTVDSDANDL